MARYVYKVEIPNKSLRTLEWLSERGYDANFYNLGTMTEETETHTTFSFTEPEAWVFNSNSECDGEAFLSCCVDSDLIEALLGFVNRIV